MTNQQLFASWTLYFNADGTATFTMQYNGHVVSATCEAFFSEL